MRLQNLFSRICKYINQRVEHPVGQSDVNVRVVRILYLGLVIWIRGKEIWFYYDGIPVRRQRSWRYWLITNWDILCCDILYRMSYDIRENCFICRCVPILDDAIIESTFIDLQTLIIRIAYFTKTHPNRNRTMTKQTWWNYPQPKDDVMQQRSPWQEEK